MGLSICVVDDEDNEIDRYDLCYGSYSKIVRVKVLEIFSNKQCVDDWKWFLENHLAVQMMKNYKELQDEYTNVLKRLEENVTDILFTFFFHSDCDDDFSKQEVKDIFSLFETKKEQMLADDYCRHIYNIFKTASDNNMKIEYC